MKAKHAEFQGRSLIGLRAGHRRAPRQPSNAANLNESITGIDGYGPLDSCQIRRLPDAYR
jgi:hypothetical protein